MTVAWLLNGTVVAFSGTHDTALTAVGNNSQTTTLVVIGSQFTSDQDFVCRVQSGEYPASPPSNTQVHLDIFRM